MTIPANADEAMQTLMSSRCLRPQTIERFGIRAEARLKAWAYPVRGGTRYKAWDPSAGRKYWHTPGVPNQLYGLDHLPEGTAEVWLVNGEPSVWACTQAGLPAISGIQGEGRLPQDAALQLMRAGVRHVHICFDLDPAGEAAAPRAASLLRPPLIVTIHRLPAALGEHADIGDLYSALGGDDAAFLDAVRELPAEPFEPDILPAMPPPPGPRIEAQSERWWRRLEILASVISAHQTVRRQGARWVTTCPFHADKNPSLVLYPDGKGYCFGCGWTGDALDYIAATQNVSLKEAMKIVAQTAYKPMHERRRR